MLWIAWHDLSGQRQAVNREVYSGTYPMHTSFHSSCNPAYWVFRELPHMLNDVMDCLTWSQWTETSCKHRRVLRDLPHTSFHSSCNLANGSVQDLPHILNDVMGYLIRSQWTDMSSEYTTVLRDLTHISFHNSCYIPSLGGTLCHTRGQYSPNLGNFCQCAQIKSSSRTGSQFSLIYQQSTWGCTDNTQRNLQCLYAAIETNLDTHKHTATEGTSLNHVTNCNPAIPTFTTIVQIVSTTFKFRTGATNTVQYVLNIGFHQCPQATSLQQSTRACSHSKFLSRMLKLATNFSMLMSLFWLDQPSWSTPCTDPNE